MDFENASAAQKAPEDNPTKSRKGRLPSSLANIISTSRASHAKWVESGLTLSWTTPAEFEQKVIKLDEAEIAKSESKTKRSPIANELTQLNNLIDGKVGNLKGNLIGKFGHRDASSHYSRFGIERKGKAYLMPRGSDERKRALDMLVTAFDEYEMPNTEYGKDFWVDINTRYNALIENSSNSAGLISQKVAEKNILIEEILMTMNSLISLTKANFPRTWQSELRAWGFQKEKY